MRSVQIAKIRLADLKSAHQLPTLSEHFDYKRPSRPPFSKSSRSPAPGAMLPIRIVAACNMLLCEKHKQMVPSKMIAVSSMAMPAGPLWHKPCTGKQANLKTNTIDRDTWGKHLTRHIITLTPDCSPWLDERQHITWTHYGWCLREPACWRLVDG